MLYPTVQVIVYIVHYIDYSIHSPLLWVLYPTVQVHVWTGQNIFAKGDPSATLINRPMCSARWIALSLLCTLQASTGHEGMSPKWVVSPMPILPVATIHLPEMISEGHAHARHPCCCDGTHFLYPVYYKIFVDGIATVLAGLIWGAKCGYQQCHWCFRGIPLKACSMQRLCLLVAKGSFKAINVIPIECAENRCCLAKWIECQFTSHMIFHVPVQ